MKRLAIFTLFFFITQIHADVTLKEITGRRIPFSSLSGKWVFINYWANWCKVCIAEIPALNHFYKTHKKNVELYAVNYDFLSPAILKKLNKKLNIQYPSIEDPAFDLDLGDIRGVPVTFVFNPKGEFVDTLYGQQTIRSLKQVMIQ